ncbi:hypothetical protein SUDANB178_03442 [Streptomyces sp. enrichment culture]
MRAGMRITVSWAGIPTAPATHSVPLLISASSISSALTPWRTYHLLTTQQYLGRMDEGTDAAY